jgi:hypothetical protein
MSIFFSVDDQPRCKYCRNALPSYSMSGHCPHCGHWYAVERATIEPSRTRAIALLVRSRPMRALQVSAVWTGVAAAALIVGNATVVVLIGRMALKSLWRACGMQW